MFCSKPTSLFCTVIAPNSDFLVFPSHLPAQMSRTLKNTKTEDMDREELKTALANLEMYNYMRFFDTANSTGSSTICFVAMALNHLCMLTVAGFTVWKGKDRLKFHAIAVLRKRPNQGPAERFAIRGEGQGGQFHSS